MPRRSAKRRVSSPRRTEITARCWKTRRSTRSRSARRTIGTRCRRSRRRCEQFGAGMITGWGAHHIDIAHWGMGMEHSGPIWVEAQAQFATGGLWDVHGDFHAEAKYANGAVVQLSNKNPVGVRFEGDK